MKIVHFQFDKSSPLPDVWKKANLIEIPFDASTTLSGAFRLN